MRKTEPCDTLAAKTLESDFRRIKTQNEKSPKVRRLACGTLHCGVNERMKFVTLLMLLIVQVADTVECQKEK